LEPDAPSHSEAVQAQFTRAADVFAERSRGRFDKLDAVAFSRIRPGQTAVEVGAGTGHFISAFSELAGLTVAVDLTQRMLQRARRDHPELALIAADGSRLPLASRSVDLVATAQALHHIWNPVDVLKECRRVCSEDGHVLVLDSVATEHLEEAEMMNALDRLRDPSHAAFRSPSTMKVIVQAAGLEIVDEHLSVGRQRLSEWMWPGEFPEGRIEQVGEFIAKHGGETGMEFEREGDDWSFTRRRLMLLARRA
jgi:SAM-dependent methyltransferase